MNSDLPAGIDQVGQTIARLQLNAHHHNDLRAVEFAIVSQGNQCAIMKRRLIRRGTSTEVPIDEWKVLFWFDPKKPPDPDDWLMDIREWLAASIDELAKEIMQMS